MLSWVFTHDDNTNVTAVCKLHFVFSITHCTVLSYLTFVPLPRLAAKSFYVAFLWLASLAKGSLALSLTRIWLILKGSLHKECRSNFFCSSSRQPARVSLHWDRDQPAAAVVVGREQEGMEAPANPAVAVEGPRLIIRLLFGFVLNL